MEFAPIAQLDRVPDYESVGRVFESPWARQENQEVSGIAVSLFSFGVHMLSNRAKFNPECGKIIQVGLHISS